MVFVKKIDRSTLVCETQNSLILNVLLGTCLIIFMFVGYYKYFMFLKRKKKADLKKIRT
jgi:hypothetical protein